jgi:hypothetical protein
LSPRQFATGVWTGDEVLLIGGSDAPPCHPSAECATPETPPLADGAALDPDTGAWRAIAPAPLPIGWADAVVVGETAYLWIPGGPRPGERPAFLAYDIAGDRWSELPPPTEETGWYGIEAAGDLIVAFSGSDEQGERPDFVFDVTTGAWTQLPDDPNTDAFDRTMAWSGSELVLFDHELVPKPNSAEPSLVRVSAYDLEAGTWRDLPDSEILYSGPWLAAGSSLVNPTLGNADGGEVDNWGRSYPYGGVLDVATGEWSALPDPPVPVDDSTFSAGAFTADTALYAGDNGWVLDLTKNVWIDPPPPRDSDGWAGGQTVVAAGTDLFVFGGARIANGASAEVELLAVAWLWSPRPNAATEPPAPTPEPSAVVQAIDCDDPITATTPYPGGPGATGPQYAIPDAWLTGLDNTDRAEPQSPDLVVVSRDGRRIAAIELVAAEGNTWWIESFAACRDAGIRLDWPPDPVPANVPDVAEIRCDGTTLELVTPFVRPQRDGVHLRFVNTGTAELGYSINAAGGGAGAGGPPGASEDVYTFAPGRATITCSDPYGREDPSEIPHEHHLTIVDPEGLYVPTDLDGCPDGEQFSYVADFAPDAKGEPGDPVDVAREHLRANHRLAPDDTVERAGYPAEPTVRVRMVRDGKTVVVVDLSPANGGGWLVGSGSGCAGFE